MKLMKLTRVRLTDIPFEKRMAAARRESNAAADDEERSDLILAAMFPSDKAYYVYTADAGPLRAAA